MNSAEATTLSPAAAIRSGVEGLDKHCVFRCERSWFSLPAVSVREITVAPGLVQVPSCDQVLAGLCHLRSEFVPVVSLSRLLNLEAEHNSTVHGTLLVINAGSVWAMLIDEAASLESLETLVSPDQSLDEMNLTPVMGTAMFRDQIVRVLDPNNIFRMVQQSLDQMWHGTHPDHSSFSL